MIKKVKQSDVPEDRKVGASVGEGPVITSPSTDKKEDDSEEKKVELMFKQNRTFELRLGRNYLIFNGREKKIRPVSILEHPDFTPEIKKYFVIQEVE